MMTHQLQWRTAQVLSLVVMIIVLTLVINPSPNPLLAATPTRIAATPLPAPTAATSLPKSPVAVIRLRTEQSSTRPIHSVVQWQDSQGNFHDVDGWRGEVIDGQTLWWVEAKDWSTGPFRWIIYASDKLHPIAISKPFQLPSQAGERLEIVLETTR